MFRSRGHPDQEAASAREQFFGNQDRKGSSNGERNDSDPPAAGFKLIEIGMVTGPKGASSSSVAFYQAAGGVSVRIENADSGNPAFFPAQLASGLAQQAFRFEIRGGSEVLVSKEAAATLPSS